MALLQNQCPLSHTISRGIDDYFLSVFGLQDEKNEKNRRMQCVFLRVANDANPFRAEKQLDNQHIESL